MQFLDPEIARILQFLDPEIMKMDKKILHPEIVEMVQFLDPEIVEKVDKTYIVLLSIASNKTDTKLALLTFVSYAGKSIYALPPTKVIFQ